MRLGETMGNINRSPAQSLDVISGWDQEEDITIAGISGAELDLTSESDLLPNGIARGNYVCIGFSNETDTAGVVAYKLEESSDTTARTKYLNAGETHRLGPVIGSIVKATTTITAIKLYYKDRYVYNGAGSCAIDL